jgi:hypothetical protein
MQFVHLPATLRAVFLLKRRKSDGKRTYRFRKIINKLCVIDNPAEIGNIAEKRR